ncbi:MAG TPA: hypothetical protein VFR67_00390 [Pilimelia sp.]|nr:hypothetical protein [Pilimelia sp.]
MNEKESLDAAAEARRDITTPHRRQPHVDKIGHYLAGMAYAVTHPHKSGSEESDRERAETAPDETHGDPR